LNDFPHDMLLLIVHRKSAQSYGAVGSRSLIGGSCDVSTSCRPRQFVFFTSLP
jgi:hypothetical protein